jgi:peroxiredoxin
LPERDVEEVLAEICDMDAPLWRRLELYVETQRAHGIPFAAASDRLVARLKEGEVGRDAPEIGAVMPDFLLPDQRGRLVRLSDLTEAGPVVLSFNRGHWCPFCQLELNVLAEAHAELVGLGATVVSVMPDRQVYLGRLPRAVVGRLTILADLDSAYALSLGLTMWLGDELKALMLQFGLSLEEVQGNASWIVPLPATFVLDADGRVVARKVEAEFRQRLSVEEIRAALAAIESRGAGKT